MDEREGSSAEVEDSSSRRKSEEEVYTLLFREVDSDRKGLVAVDSLVDYLHQIQLGTSHSRRAGLEDVYDSHDDVHQVKYNLQLLKAMLEEVSNTSGQVDQATYSRVIRMWVKDVRDRSNCQQPSLEVSQLSSDSEDNEDGVTPRSQQCSFEADQSYETSGGNSSTHSGFDHLASLEDMRQENRRFMEKERQLQASLSQSEEQLRALQAENSSLLTQLRGLQQQLLRLEAIDKDKTTIQQALKEEEVRCEELTGTAERMAHQLAEAQREVVRLQERVQEEEKEREGEVQEVTELQQQLLAKEVVLEQERQRAQEVQTQLSTLLATQDNLRSKVTVLEESNTLLQKENEELHSSSVPTGPSYSTPARATEPPSLQEELSRHGNLSGQTLPSPLVGVDCHHDNNKEFCRLENHYDNSDPSLSRSHGNISVEDLEYMARSSSNKFHSKTEVIVRLLSELLNSSHHSQAATPSHSSESITEVGHTKTQNLRQLITCVKKLYSEKKHLKAQVTELQNQLEERGREEVDAAVQTAPPPDVTTPTETEPRCGLIDRVARGVVWALFVAVLLVLLLAMLVWLHEQLHPCCHGNLTPGGMIWALLQPHVTVTHHGHI